MGAHCKNYHHLKTKGLMIPFGHELYFLMYYFVHVEVPKTVATLSFLFDDFFMRLSELLKYLNH